MAYASVSGFVKDDIEVRAIDDGDIALECYALNGPNIALHLKRHEAERIAREILDTIEQDAFEGDDDVRVAHIFPDEQE